MEPVPNEAELMLEAATGMVGCEAGAAGGGQERTGRGRRYRGRGRHAGEGSGKEEGTRRVELGWKAEGQALRAGTRLGGTAGCTRSQAHAGRCK
eukprot:6170683-Prymnesium_polylepis.2